MESEDRAWRLIIRNDNVGNAGPRYGLQDINAADAVKGSGNHPESWVDAYTGAHGDKQHDYQHVQMDPEGC